MARISIAAGDAAFRQGRFRSAEAHPAGELVNYIPWGRLAKFGVGAALLGIGALTTYQQVIVRVSREAVINARVVSIRAPMDGIVKAAASAPGTAVRAGMAIGQIDDPVPDDARSFQLQLDLKATERERDLLSRRLDDLQRARAEANTQAESFQLGRVRQDELRVDGARARGAGAGGPEEDATAALSRGAALHANGYMADAAYEHLYHAREAVQQETIAARKRLATPTGELEGAPNGTYLGDNYNDAPSSVQRARELTVRIDETKASLDELIQKDETITAQLTAERRSLPARSSAALTAPIDGNLWTVQAAAGED